MHCNDYPDLVISTQLLPPRTTTSIAPTPPLPFIISSEQWIIYWYWKIDLVFNRLKIPNQLKNSEAWCCRKNIRTTKEPDSFLFNFLNLLFTIHLKMRLITCKTVIWWMFSVFKMAHDLKHIQGLAEPSTSLSTANAQWP